MPSCSRIARRCGERDASSNGAGSAACNPELLRRPPTRPLCGDVVVVLVRLRLVRGVQLDHPLDLEAVVAQQVDLLSRGQMELNLLCVGPLDLVQVAQR